MPLQRYNSPNTLGLRTLYILPFSLLPLLTGCGDVEDDYYPSVHSIKVAVGKDYIDVTIRGSVNNVGDFISDVEVIKVGHNIILIPIAKSFGPAPALDPFEETVRIGGLQRGHYAIIVIGRDEATGEKTVIEKKVEVK
jgi:hypothetical protein